MQRELSMYLKTGVIGLLVFGASYWYIQWMKIPSELNKAAADTAVLLMGFSMLQSVLSYYFNAFDRAIIYRKYFGLVGFAFAVAHLVLSWGAFLRLFSAETWTTGSMYPVLTGTVAMLIFTIMALISNTVATKVMGSTNWRRTLRLGYTALLLVLAHIVLLKGARWVTWFEEGMQRPPSLSLISASFIVVVVLLRLVMWGSLAREQARRKKILAQPVKVRK